ncbi:MAG: hypothetical protein R3F48_00350 [Candidatus Zixiibacteriota bacterium]
MNIKRLRQAEKEFLNRYPGGFEHPEMLELAKKHKKDKLTNLARDYFAKKNFSDPHEIVASMVKLVAQSTMVSLFEKPKFRDMATSLTPREKEIFSRALKDLLYGKEQKGFEALLSELANRKMAKWTLMTVFKYYFRPEVEVFVKPSTAKLVISSLELDLVYKPRPSWEFYAAYRDIINDIKSKVDITLSPSNAAFCGFLMMALDEEMMR